MVEKIKHVCFDKDGTLIDVHRSWVPITRRRTLKISEFYGLGEDLHKPLALAMGVDIVRQKIVHGGPVGYKARPVIIETVVRWLQDRGILATDEDLTSIFSQVDRDVQKDNDFNAVALPGVLEGIERLHRAGLKLSVYTSDRHKNAERVLNILKLDRCIDAIVGGDDVRCSKPDPEGFMAACASVRVPMDESIYVGDGIDDMKMAARRGFGLTHGIATKDELAPFAREVFDHFTDLTDFLLTN